MIRVFCIGWSFDRKFLLVRHPVPDTYQTKRTAIRQRMPDLLKLQVRRVDECLTYKNHPPGERASQPDTC